MHASCVSRQEIAMLSRSRARLQSNNSSAVPQQNVVASSKPSLPENTSSKTTNADHHQSIKLDGKITARASRQPKTTSVAAAATVPKLKKKKKKKVARPAPKKPPNVVQELTSWIIVRPTRNLFDNQRQQQKVELPCLYGQLLVNKATGQTQEFCSSCSETRRTDGVVVTKSGSYKLIGSICLDHANLSGYDAELLRAFSNGFPYLWKATLAKFHARAAISAGGQQQPLSTSRSDWDVDGMQSVIFDETTMSMSTTCNDVADDSQLSSMLSIASSRVSDGVFGAELDDTLVAAETTIISSKPQQQQEMKRGRGAKLPPKQQQQAAATTTHQTPAARSPNCLLDMLTVDCSPTPRATKMPSTNKTTTAVAVAAAAAKQPQKSKKTQNAKTTTTVATEQPPAAAVIQAILPLIVPRMRTRFQDHHQSPTHKQPQQHSVQQETTTTRAQSSMQQRQQVESQWSPFVRPPSSMSAAAAATAAASNRCNSSNSSMATWSQYNALLKRLVEHRNIHNNRTRGGQRSTAKWDDVLIKANLICEAGRMRERLLGVDNTVNGMSANDTLRVLESSLMPKDLDDLISEYAANHDVPGCHLRYNVDRLRYLRQQQLPNVTISPQLALEQQHQASPASSGNLSNNSGASPNASSIIDASMIRVEDVSTQQTIQQQSVVAPTPPANNVMLLSRQQNAAAAGQLLLSRTNALMLSTGNLGSRLAIHELQSPPNLRSVLDIYELLSDEERSRLEAEIAETLQNDDNNDDNDDAVQSVEKNRRTVSKYVRAPVAASKTAAGKHSTKAKTRSDQSNFAATSGHIDGDEAESTNNVTVNNAAETLPDPAKTAAAAAANSKPAVAVRRVKLLSRAKPNASATACDSSTTTTTANKKASTINPEVLSIPVAEVRQSTSRSSSHPAHGSQLRSNDDTITTTQTSVADNTTILMPPSDTSNVTVTSSSEENVFKKPAVPSSKVAAKNNNNNKRPIVVDEATCEQAQGPAVAAPPPRPVKRPRRNVPPEARPASAVSTVAAAAAAPVVAARNPVTAVPAAVTATINTSSESSVHATPLPKPKPPREHLRRTLLNLDTDEVMQLGEASAAADGDDELLNCTLKAVKTKRPVAAVNNKHSTFFGASTSILCGSTAFYGRGGDTASVLAMAAAQPVAASKRAVGKAASVAAVLNTSGGDGGDPAMYYISPDRKNLKVPIKRAKPVAMGKGGGGLIRSPSCLSFYSQLGAGGGGGSMSVAGVGRAGSIISGANASKLCLPRLKKLRNAESVLEDRIREENVEVF